MPTPTAWTDAAQRILSRKEEPAMPAKMSGEPSMTPPPEPRTAAINEPLKKWVHRKAKEVRSAPTATPAPAPLDVLDIVKRHTHQGIWAMTRHAGEAPEDDCLLCRALVSAGVLTLDEIGAGTRSAVAGPDAGEPEPLGFHYPGESAEASDDRTA